MDVCVRGNEVTALEVYGDRTKEYNIHRKQKKNENIVSHPASRDCYNDVIRVFVLFSEKERRYVNKMQESLANKKIVWTKGLDDTIMSYDKIVDVTNDYDYVVVIISKSFLEDLVLLDVLAANYQIENENNKILPMIVWKDLYEPEVKAEVLEGLQNRISEYKQKHFDDDFDGNAAKELKRMHRILKMLKDFIYFAVERDKKRNLPISDKLLQYIIYDRGEDVADKVSVGGDKVDASSQPININVKGQFNMVKDNGTINATIINEK